MAGTRIGLGIVAHDADLNPEIGRGLRRRESSVDFRGSEGVIPDATYDPEVLLIEAQAGRVLVTRDITTMPGHLIDSLRCTNLPASC